MGFGQWVELAVFLTACALGTGGVRLLARGVSGAAEPLGASVPAASRHRASAPTQAASAKTPSRVLASGVRRPMIPMPNAVHLARIADEVRTRFTPVAMDAAHTANPAVDPGGERSGYAGHGVRGERVERVQLAVDPASA